VFSPYGRWIRCGNVHLSIFFWNSNSQSQKEKKKTAERTHPYINTSIYKYINKYIDRWDSFLKIPAVTG
jgi:hypothetical protein